MKNKFLLLAITILILSINSFAQNHAIGERFGGGIIFYVESSGQHGLIADSSDQKNANWSEAINECKTLRDGGYTDWRLPIRTEMELLYKQISFFESINPYSFYWSSEEMNSSEFAFVFEFNLGFPNGVKKTSTQSVRAVRSF